MDRVQPTPEPVASVLAAPVAPVTRTGRVGIGGDVR